MTNYHLSHEKGQRKEAKDNLHIKSCQKGFKLKEIFGKFCAQLATVIHLSIEKRPEPRKENFLHSII